MALGLVTSIFDSSAPTAEQQGELISNTAEMVTNALSKLPTSISGKEEIVSRLTESLVKLKLESAYRIAGWQFFLCLGIAFVLFYLLQRFPVALIFPWHHAIALITARIAVIRKA